MYSKSNDSRDAVDRPGVTRYGAVVRTLFTIVAVVSASILLPTTADARSNRVRQIPNGTNYTCDSCHGKRSLLPEDLTPFGDDVNDTLQNGNVNWSVLWNIDSDGDGFSNGLELGDPNGNWSTGQQNPDAPTANPGVPNEGICGNTVAEPDEDCDSSDFRSETCESLGFGQGTLKCHPLCRWDTSECGFCGDGFLNPNYEDCDIDAFPEDLSCTEYGFLRGELSCTPDCDIDESTCTDEAPAVCGDGIISRGEFCDGDNFGTVDCVRIAYAGGDLKCTDECAWDASDCVFNDGRRVGDEERAEDDPGDPIPTLDMGTQQPPTGDASSAADGGAVRGTGNCATTAGADSFMALLFALLFVRRR